MDEVSSKILGFFSLIAAWIFPFVIASLPSEISHIYFIYPASVVILLVLSYCLFCNIHYPFIFVTGLLINNYLVNSMFHTYFNVYYDLYLIQLVLGTILVLGGNYTRKFFTAMLSPLQEFLKIIGLRVNISPIAAVLSFPLLVISFKILKSF